MSPIRTPDGNLQESRAILAEGGRPSDTIVTLDQSAR